MIINYFAIIFLISVSSYTLFATNTNQVSPNTSDSHNKNNIRCYPTVLYKGDTLTIKMKIPHGEYLGIINPAGEMFFVVYPSPEKGKDSLMPSNIFVNLDELKIITNVTRAVPWIAGRGMEIIFSKAGDYQILLSDNLESDAEYPIIKCIVKYKDKPAKEKMVK